MNNLLTLTSSATLFFDFDGLLVDTEPLHYQAYRKMMENNHLPFPWDFSTYVSMAHTGAQGLNQMIAEKFPDLLKKKKWDALYAEKKREYERLLEREGVNWMPGAPSFLSLVKSLEIPHCVVTNSARKQVDLCKTHLPLLKQIPLWVTREDYKNPKPAKDGYVKAIEWMRPQGIKIGFEDTLRGIAALKGAHIDPILICSKEHPQMGQTQEGYPHFESLECALKKIQPE